MNVIVGLIGPRAAASRYGSMMLSRTIAAPSTHLYATQTRAFSTSLALRFYASRPFHNEPEQKPRLNPLVGNYVLEPAAPKPAPAPRPVARAFSPSSSSPSELQSSSNADFVPPPPPPPPPPAAEESSSQPPAHEAAKPDYPYNAADSSKPLGIDIAAILADRAAAYGQSLGVGDPILRPKVRAKAVTGRTVFIKDRLTPTSAPTAAVAIRVLERMCREQKVKNKYHSQKFHERKGLKKKRLRSQRWRARFKTGFKAAVSKVMELKKQGW